MDVEEWEAGFPQAVAETYFPMAVYQLIYKKISTFFAVLCENPSSINA
jgi:hypothetical protein